MISCTGAPRLRQALLGRGETLQPLRRHLFESGIAAELRSEQPHEGSAEREAELDRAEMLAPGNDRPDPARTEAEHARLDALHRAPLAVGSDHSGAYAGEIVAVPAWLVHAQEGGCGREMELELLDVNAIAPKSLEDGACEREQGLAVAGTERLDDGGLRRNGGGQREGALRLFGEHGAGERDEVLAFAPDRRLLHRLEAQACEHEPAKPRQHDRTCDGSGDHRPDRPGGPQTLQKAAHHSLAPSPSRHRRDQNAERSTA